MVDRKDSRYRFLQDGCDFLQEGRVDAGSRHGDDASLDRILAMSEHDSIELRQAFHRELDALDDTFVTAGLRIADQMPEIVADYMAGQAPVMDRANTLAVTVADECDRIDDAGFVLLAREAPVGGDLRRLVALLRMTVDVSRSASLLRHAAHTLRTFNPQLLAEPLRSQLGEMGSLSAQVFSAGVDAWRRRDALAVADIDQMDEDVDRLQVVLLRETSAGGDDIGAGMLVLGLLARYFERIADHGVEIARDAAFVATGQRVRVGRRRAESAGDAGRGPAERDVN